ncbi:MAG TPA: AfsR/SARP family transcriptional regulator, partial [Pseudonocardiaceae bacterium]|nr:AfsR/SARP family transcriptional regulator [Pseudonocardiaceae bacterium]
TDRLIEVLWGYAPPASAENTLQTYVSHLRKALEPGRAPRAQHGLLRTRSSGYELGVPPEAIDAVRFERLARAGHDALPEQPGRAAEILRAANALWRGEALTDFSLELFAQSEITRLTELRIAAMEDRVEADLALGRHVELCSELSQAVTEQPQRERLWSQFIRALYRSGRQADALAAYTRLRTQLAEQLGIDPSPELVRLHEAVLAQRPDLEWRPAPQRLTRGPSSTTERSAEGEPLPQARAALAAYDWQRAYELFSRAEQAGPLSAEDLDGLAEAAFWSMRDREAQATWQRAHRAHLEAGQPRRAGVDAFLLTMYSLVHQQFAVARGWFQRLRRLLETEPDCLEHGYLFWAAMIMALLDDDREKCLAAADSTYEAGVRHGVADFQAVGLVFRGGMLIRQGRVEEGLGMHDEGMAMLVSGSLSQLATAQTYCQLIRTCYERGDYRRAHEWTQAAEDCFARTGLSSFPGDCETHRTAILINSGAWTLAEEVAHRACAATQYFDLRHVGQAFASIGDVRLRIGDLAGAEEAFAKAEERFAVSLPGRARLELLRGRPAAAAALIKAALDGGGLDQLARTWLLPDQVTIALALDDLDTARAAAAELASSAELYGSKAMHAAAQGARGAVALATGEDDPVPSLRRSVTLWQEAGSPYESARVRVVLSTALERAGRLNTARVQLAAARDCFHRLGARLDAETATARPEPPDRTS